MKRLSQITFWAVIVFIFLNFFQVSRYYQHSPFLSTDDSLANVSFSLAENGIYGFPISPLQAPSTVLRHDGFFNYGPFYFYFAAGLVKIFGFSYELFRLIPPAVSLFLFFVLLHSYRRKSVGLLSFSFGSIFLGIVLNGSQVFVARPDSFVALFGALASIWSMKVIWSRRLQDFFILGVFASFSSFSHLFAAGISLATPLIALTAVYLDPNQKEFRSYLYALLSLTAGGLLGLVSFFASFHFKISDFFEFLSAYSQTHFVHKPYFSVVADHLNLAFSFLGKPVLALAHLFLFFAFSIGFRHAWKTKSLTWPVACSLGSGLMYLIFVLSLGRHAWVSFYYVITIQALFAVAIIGQIEFLLEWSKSQNRTILRKSFSALLLAAIALAGVRQIKLLYTTHSRIQQARTFTPYSEYYREVTDDLPTGARVLGTIMFGVEAPKRYSFLQFYEGLYFLSEKTPNPKHLTPTHVVWGLNENVIYQAKVGRGQTDSNLKQLSTYFPLANFCLNKLSLAYPHGVTRVFENTPECKGSIRYKSYNTVTQSWEYLLEIPEADKVSHSKEETRVTLNGNEQQLFSSIRFNLSPGKTYAFEISAPMIGTNYCLFSTNEIKADLGYLPLDQMDCAHTLKGEKIALMLHFAQNTEVYLGSSTVMPSLDNIRIYQTPQSEVSSYLEQLIDYWRSTR